MSRKERLRARKQNDSLQAEEPHQFDEMSTFVTYQRFSDEFLVSKNVQYGNYYFPNAQEQLYQKDIRLPGGQIIKICATGQQYQVFLTLTNTSPAQVLLTRFKCPNYNMDFPSVQLQPNLQAPHALQNQYLVQNGGKIKYTFDVEIVEDGNFRNFVTDIANMRGDNDFADATLCCDGDDVRGHVAILVARSKHFKQMFGQKDFVEGKTKRVTIKDMKLATLKDMLKFIYCNKFDTEKTDVSALFSAAHLYAIPDLVSECEGIMTKTLTVDNAAGFFFKGFLTETDGLKKASMDFISKNFAEVKSTEGWKSLMKDGNSSLALEEILSFATSNK